MAVITVFQVDSPRVVVDEDTIRVNVGEAYIRLYEGEAVKLRDDLSAAILEAATAAAKAKVPTSEVVA